MPIDLERVVGIELDGTEFSWADDDIILYNLGLGAGDRPDDPAELKYTYEGELVATPSFGTIPPFAMMMGVGAVDGLDINLAQILHGDQELTVHGPIPTSGSVTQTGRIVDIYDKGRGALIVVEAVSTLESTGESLFTNRSGIYVRGEGGFGGQSGPSAPDTPPEREPDHVIETQTLPQQALLYRLSGDKNPLHADPGFASFAGFERPILHGLCTYGVVCRAVVESVLGGVTSALGTYSARFTGHVFPGETLVTRVWDVDGRYVLETMVAERDSRVLANAAITVN